MRKLQKKIVSYFFKLNLFKKFKQPLIDFRDYLVYRNKENWVKFEYDYISKIKGKVGLEIAGPSWLFKTYMPVYRFAKKLDNINRDSRLIYGNSIIPGTNNFNYYLFKKGDQFLGEITETGLPNNKYDFILSRAVIEYTANPIKAFIELRRILKPGGLMITTVGNKIFTYDYMREYTTFSHILADFEKNVKENDETHFDEIIDLQHDLKTPFYSSKEELKATVRDNYKTRFCDHHVYSLDTLCRTISEAGFLVLDTKFNVGGNLVVIAQKYNDKNLNLKPDTKTIRRYLPK